jgi:hypothetical protein
VLHLRFKWDRRPVLDTGLGFSSQALRLKNRPNPVSSTGRRRGTSRPPPVIPAKAGIQRQPAHKANPLKGIQNRNLNLKLASRSRIHP